jgi:hypothetical protein
MLAENAVNCEVTSRMDMDIVKKCFDDVKPLTVTDFLTIYTA